MAQNPQEKNDEECVGGRPVNPVNHPDRGLYVMSCMKAPPVEMLARLTVGPTPRVAAGGEGRLGIASVSKVDIEVTRS